MKIENRRNISVAVVLAVLLIVVSCGKQPVENNVDTTETTESISRVDNQHTEKSPFDRADLPELDNFTLPKVTQTNIELAFSYLPESMSEVDTKYGFKMFTFTNIKKGFKRLGLDKETMSEEDLMIASMYAPDFLAGIITKPRQPIDNPANWSWKIYDKMTGGTWFAGDLFMGTKLLPAMKKDEYETDPLEASMMTSFRAPWNNKSPIYGRQVAPFSPDFGYFNFQNNNLEQADKTAVLVRQNDVYGLSINNAMEQILPFVGDTENAVFIRTDLTLSNAFQGLGISVDFQNNIKPVFENLRGYGRNLGLDWIVFSHNPDDKIPLRIILLYETNDQAILDMKLLSYITNKKMVEFEEAIMMMPGSNIELTSFSVYENIGLIECSIGEDSESMNAGFSNILEADRLANLFLSGLLPQLFINN